MKKSHIINKIAAVALLAVMVSCSSTNSPYSLEDMSKRYHDEDMENALAGDAEAQAAVAYDYKVGSVVAQDLREAEKWYRKAAEQGNIDAQSGLMRLHDRKSMYAHKNPEECVKWSEKLYGNPKADASDKLHAAIVLCNCYRDGYGVKKDASKEDEWRKIYYALNNISY